MSDELLQTDIQREKNKLYFCRTNKKTNCLIVCESNLKRGGKVGALKPRPKTEIEKRVLNTSRKKRWRAERKK